MKSIEQRRKFNTDLFEKVLDFIEYFYPNIYEKSRKRYIRENEDKFKAIQNKQNFNEDYNAWFLIKLVLPNGISVAKMAIEFPEDYFTKDEKKMLKNLSNYIESVFEILEISKNNKIYKIKDFVEDKIYGIKTFDFPVKYKEGDIIIASIVEDVEDNHFFLGAVSSYEKSNADEFMPLMLMKFALEKIEKKQRDKLKIGWETIKEDNFRDEDLWENKTKVNGVWIDDKTREVVEDGN